MAEREDRTPDPAPALPFAGDWPIPWLPVWGTSNAWTDRLAARLVDGVLDGAARLSERGLARSLGALARVARRVDRRHADAARAFLRQALGERPEAEIEQRVLDAYRHFFRLMVETRRFLFRVPIERTPEHFDVRWTDDAREVAARRQGAILVTAHLGDWEAATAIAPWLGFHPVYAVARPPKNKPLSVALQAERERRGIRLLPRRGAMREAPRILRAGGAICLLLDHRTSGRPFLAPFFGRPARCDRSAGVLLQRFHSPVIVSSCTLAEEPLSYRVEFHEVLWPEDWAKADLFEITTRINRGLERMILERPEQYFWLHDRYKDTPSDYSAGARDRSGRTRSAPAIVSDTPGQE